MRYFFIFWNKVELAIPRILAAAALFPLQLFKARSIAIFSTSVRDCPGALSNRPEAGKKLKIFSRLTLSPSVSSSARSESVSAFEREALVVCCLFPYASI